MPPYTFGAHPRRDAAVGVMPGLLLIIFLRTGPFRILCGWRVTLQPNLQKQPYLPIDSTNLLMVYLSYYEW